MHIMALRSLVEKYLLIATYLFPTAALENVRMQNSQSKVLD